MAPIFRHEDRSGDKGGPEFLFGTVMSQPVRLAFGLGPLIGVLEEHAVPLAPLLAEAEIPLFALEEPSYRIRLDQETAFTRSALARLNLPHAGLTIGQRYHINSFGILGLAAASAPTLLEMQRTVLSYPVLAWGMFELSMWRDQSQGVLRLEGSVDLGDCHDFFLLRDMVCAVTIFRDAVGANSNPASVHLRRSTPQDPKPYEQFFACHVYFDAPYDEVRFDDRNLMVRPLQANEMSFRFYEAQCRRVSETLTAPLDYADIVRSRLRAATPIPGLVEIAAALHLTARTLQRRLAAESAGFTELLKEVRLDRARQLLARNDLLLDEIAYRLGFLDVVAFSRAFKSWTGVAPSRYRARTGMTGAAGENG
ncbi:MAG: AraC-like DNA-binding protein [Hyphomicrobiaceae bacterium]|jgi:AraC-like DNA-binding protein